MTCYIIIMLSYVEYKDVETMVTLTSVVWSYSFVIAQAERVENRRYIHVAEHAAAGSAEKKK